MNLVAAHDTMRDTYSVDVAGQMHLLPHATNKKESF